MPEEIFYFNSTCNKYSIDPTEIKSVGGPESPKLQILLALEMDPGQGEQSQPFILLPIDAKLKVFDSPIGISSGSSIPSFTVSKKISFKVMIEFELSSYKILKIEERRIDNLKASLDLTFRALKFEIISLPPGSSKRKLNVLTDLSSFYGSIGFEIPHSQWISKHLPELGWDSSTLIELPSANKLIPDEYSQSLAELGKANEYFTKGDYDKVVAHCRSAIEPIKERLPSLKNYIESRNEFDWIKKINESTFIWLDTVIKATSNYSSKAHHAPSIGHFSKHDAQVVQLITTAIIAYAGKCISEHSP